MKPDPVMTALLQRIVSNQEALFSRMDNLEGSINKGIAVTQMAPMKQQTNTIDQIARAAIAPYLLNHPTV